MAEEKRHNPRLGGDANPSDFAGYMNHLGLPHPKLIDIAVPANLRCGRPADDADAPDEPDWAPLTYTFGGIWEITPAALEECLASRHGPRVQVVDVREADEFSGPLGHLRDALLLPLPSLAAHLGALDRHRPVVTVCRSGTRSAQASVLLRKAGLEQVANLAGGMLRWRAESLPVEGGAA